MINGLRKTDNQLEVAVDNYHSRTEKKTKESWKIVIVFNQEMLCILYSANVSLCYRRRLRRETLNALISSTG